jgi:O-antigen ligase
MIFKHNIIISHIKKCFTKDKISNFLLLLIIFLIPLQTRYIYEVLGINNQYFEYGNISIYITDILILFYIIFNLKNLIKIVKNKENFKFIILYLSLFTILILFNNKIVSIYWIVRIFYLILFFVIILKEKCNKEKIYLTLIYSSTIQAVISILQFYKQNIISNKYLGLAGKFASDLGPSIIEGGGLRILRGYGLFTHPNILGIYLILGITLLIYFIFKDNKYKNLYYFLLGLNIIGLIYSFSRLNYIFLLISMFSIFIIYKKSIKEKITILIIFLSLVIINFNFIRIRINPESRLNINSNKERLLEYNDLDTISLINGVGIRNYTFYMFDKDSEIEIWELTPIHNIYLLSIIESGILISFIFLLILSFPYYLFLKNLKKQDQENIIIMFIYSIFIINGFFEHFLITENVGLLLLGLIYIIYLKNNITIDT